MLIQVPLKYRAPHYDYPLAPMKMASPGEGMAKAAAAPAAASQGYGGGGGDMSRRAVSDVDTAVLGHGPSEGPYTELDGLKIARDPRFPIRVTLQFYQATSNGVVSRDNIKAMAAQIKKVYGKGDYVGSLVVPTALDRTRPTNWTGDHTAELVSLYQFPGLVERFGLNVFLPMPPRPEATTTIGIK
jgi:hypothetical protein